MQRALCNRTDVDTEFAEGVAAAARCAFADALAHFDAVLARSPQHAPALVNRGVALRALGRAGDACASFTAALRQNPDDADIHNNLGGALHDLGQREAALDAFARAVALAPCAYEPLVNYGATLVEAGRHEDGLARLAEAAALAPRRFEAYARLAEALVEVDRLSEALAQARTAIAMAPHRREGYAASARALRALGRSDEALAALDAVIQHAPEDAAAHEARGVLLAEAGKIEAARTAYLTALRFDPRYARAHFGLAVLGRLSASEIEAMERLAKDPALSPADRPFVLYAQAKAYDERGDFAAAFAAAEAGASLRRRLCVPDETREMLRLARAAPGAQGQPPDPGDPSEAPIFVFGVPRSGTSLVEQILATCSDVHALGETEIIGRHAEALSGRALAEAYLAELPAAARAARRFVDKSLGNIVQIGAIRFALPRAKLVYVRRDPMDVGLSCYFSLFAGEMPFAPDLGAIGRYISGCAELMAAWRRALPPQVWREVEYERLVQDPENETRALFSFCGLEWDSRCLTFHETARAVKTASLAEVRRPLYASSVGRARPYAAFLAPLRQGLETPPPVDILPVR